MNTSYFAKYRGEKGICIAIKHPNGFKGYCYPDLFPKWSFLSKYKQDGDEESYTKAYYEEVLSKLNPNKVWQDLQNAVLLCWETPGKFCHRRLVAAWLEKELGVSIPEL